MIERHYDDEALISLLESNRAATDTHLPSCTPCSEKIESFRLIAEALTDGDVWDTRELRTAAVPSTIATLRAFADRMTDEDARAALILPELLAGPRETWMPRLHEHPEWRTAGVVRGLIAAAYDAVMQMPPDAVEMTRMAVEIADGLDAPASQNTALLRGSAWRNHAYTLYYVGSFNDARRAIAAANAAFVGFASDTYESARLGIVESLVLRAFERIDDAMCVAESSAQIFDVFSDVDRGASARLAEVHLLFSRNEYSKADAVLRQLDAQLTDTEFVDTHARVLGNLGICARKLGKPDEAVRYLEMSAALNASLGAVTEVTRIGWEVARLLVDVGKLTEAYDRLSVLMTEMERLGMTSEAAYMALDMSELLLAKDRYDEVESLCRRAMHLFERAGVSYTTRALVALGFMSDAVRQRNASRALVRQVRDYIQRLPSQPNLLFAPSPFDQPPDAYSG